MRRLVACLLVAVLTGPWGQALPQHVHAGGTHSHPEHEHGPAVHAHAPRANAAFDRASDDSRPHIEGCDARDHVRSSVFGAACAPQAHAFAAAIVWSTSTLAPLMATPRVVAPTDTRVHDPPRRAASSPRAPPLITLA